MRVLLLLGLLVGCTEQSEAGSDAQVAPPSEEAGTTDAGEAGPGELDAGETDAGDAAPEADTAVSACEQHWEEIATFVAAHRSCTVDADCVMVGDCSHANFQSVAREFEEEAQALVLADQCAAQDGPTYHAVCRAGSCERKRAPRWCGGFPQDECPSGTSRYQAGCGSVAATFEDGCHAACDGEGDDDPCGAGFTCQKTTTNPCVPAPGGDGSTCAACGAESWLCLPSPACELELSVSFDGRPVETVLPSLSTELQLWLENRSDQPITFSFDMPCHGPRVQGLGDYDLWQECLAGACLTDPVRIELTLAPGERLRWRSAVIDPLASTCNPDGLPVGEYTPSFALTNLQGATACGPAPASLSIRGPASP